MSSFKIRPRFRQHFESEPEAVALLFKDRIKHENEDGLKATFSGHHIIITAHPDDLHYWSPRLTLSIEEDPDEGNTLVRGLYGPPPSVWTMFAFGYFALAVAFMVTGIAAYSYHMLDIESKLVWLLPIYAVAALTLYIIAQFGQKMAAEQTYMLHHFYEETVGRKVHFS